MLYETPLFIRLKEPRCVAKTINIFSNKYCFADSNRLTFIYRVTIRNNVRVTASVSKREKFQERNADTFPTQKIKLFMYSFKRFGIPISLPFKVRGNGRLSYFAFNSRFGLFCFEVYDKSDAQLLKINKQGVTWIPTFRDYLSV